MVFNRLSVGVEYDYWLFAYSIVHITHTQTYKYTNETKTAKVKYSRKA